MSSETVAQRRTVVICCYTLDRWEELGMAVREAHRQSTEGDQVVVVVDHNPVLLERCSSEFPHAMVIENTLEPGLSGARNSGVRQAKGDLVVFLDDDALPQRGWLEALTHAFTSPDVKAVGGAATPGWQRRRPPWLPAEFDWVVGCTYIGMPTRRERIRNVMGCNMAFHRSVFDAGLTFPTGVGRTATRLDGAEETAFCIRVTQRWPHAEIVFEPGAGVLHRVPGERGSWGYFFRRCYAEGRSKARMSGLVGRGDALSSEWSYTLRVLPEGIGRGLREALAGDPTGIARSAAILAGLAVTSGGYLTTRLTGHTSRSLGSSTVEGP